MWVFIFSLQDKWDKLLCSLECGYRHFRGILCFLLQVYTGTVTSDVTQNGIRERQSVHFDTTPAGTTVFKKVTDGCFIRIQEHAPTNLTITKHVKVQALQDFFHSYFSASLHLCDVDLRWPGAILRVII